MYEKMAAMAEAPAMQLDTIAYLTSHLSKFVKKGDSVKAVLDDGKIVYKKVDAACDGGN